MKKGFTMIELLGVIVILAILLTVTFTSVSVIIKDSRNSVYKKQLNSILNAAYDWSLKHPNTLPKNKGEKTYIPLLQLQRSGYVDEFINPKTKEKYPLDLIISIEYTGGNYRYNSMFSKLNGNYLYTVLSNDNNRTTNNIIKPVITFDDSHVIDNGDGTYSTTFELGYPYTYYSPTATIGEKNVTNILSVVLDNTYEKNGKEVVEDTTKKAIYYKYFIVTDNSGNSSYALLKIIIQDTEAPTLIVPENDVISTSVNEYDLMEGVTCTDNSKKCSISVEGEINFGREDSYEITYKATDPSGNTTDPIKRIIRVSSNN